MEGIKREVYLARFYTRPTFMFFSLAFSGMCQSIFGHSRSHLLSKSIRAWPSVCVFSMSHGYVRTENETFIVLGHQSISSSIVRLTNDIHDHVSIVNIICSRVWFS